jgi:histidinol-phosphate aminotransferase
MFSLEKIVRPNILALKPYSSARDEFKGTATAYLDANENPFGTLNRYPDPLQKQLKDKLAEIKVFRQKTFL